MNSVYMPKPQILVNPNIIAPNDAEAEITYLTRATYDGINEQQYENAQVLDTEAEMGVGYAGQMTITELDGKFGLGYSQKVLATQSANLIAYWPLWEAAGGVADNYEGTVERDGAYSGVTLGQTGIGDGKVCPLFDGTDYTNIYSASLNAAFDGDEGTVLVWCKVVNSDAWSDGDNFRAIHIYVDGDNSIYIGKRGNTNNFQFFYEAGGVSEIREISTGTTEWIVAVMTWSKSADEVKFYFNGPQNGATATGLGVWAGNLSSIFTCIGAQRTNGDYVWKGNIAHCAIWDTPLTATDIAALSQVGYQKMYFLSQDSPAWAAQGFITQQHVRTFCKGLFGTINHDGEKYVQLGWARSGGINLIGNSLAIIYFAPNGDLNVWWWDGATTKALTLYNSYWDVKTDYKFAILLGGFDINGVPWRQGEDTANYLYGASWYMSGGSQFTDWSLIWQVPTADNTDIWGAIQSYDGSGLLDNFPSVPDMDLSAVRQPLNLTTFDDDDGTELPDITPEVGGDWVSEVGVLHVQSNKAEGKTYESNEALAYCESNNADLNVNATVKVQYTDGSNYERAGIIIRFTDTDNYWLVWLRPGINTVYLYEKNAGGWTERASATPTINGNTEYPVVVTPYGTTISAFFDRTTRILYASATHNQNATKVGVRLQRVGTPSAGDASFDNFSAHARQSSNYDILDTV